MNNHNAFGVGGGFLRSALVHIASCSYGVVQHRTINTLPDDVLLEVFNSYRQIHQDPEDHPWNWCTLTQVCQRWRNVVLASPRRLDLCLLCTHKTPVRRSLDQWPSLPIVIRYCASLQFKPPSPEDEDNVIAALEHHNRVRGIQLAVTSSLLGKIVKLMQVSFPRLTSLSLWLDKGRSNCTVPNLPNSFLGGYAPLLRDLSLIGIPFPDLPGLLSTTKGLTSLRLLEVPDTGYITPRAMATCLSMLTNLAIFCLEFRFPTRHPDYEREDSDPLPLNRNRAILQTLTHFNFRGPSDYLEDLLARVDAPSLDHVDITFFNQLIFRVPHLSHFIGRMEMLKSAKVAEMESSFGSGVSIKLDQASAGATQGTVGHPLSLCISCGVLDWQISSMAEICHQSSVFSRVEHLDVRADYLRLGYQWEDESIPWVELFRSFTSVETLSISGELCQHVAHALEVVVVAEVLPELRVLHFECSRKSASVENYVAVREKFDRPVHVQYVSFPSREMWEVSDTKNNE